MARPKLVKPHGTNRWCGPTALSVVSGKPTQHCAALANYTTRPFFKGMYNSEMREGLRCLGLKFHEESLTWQPQTLAQWAELRTPEQREVLCIVQVTSHYVTVQRSLTICSLTGREWMMISGSPCARRTAKRVWWILPFVQK